MTDTGLRCWELLVTSRGDYTHNNQKPSGSLQILQHQEPSDPKPLAECTTQKNTSQVRKLLQLQTRPYSDLRVGACTLQWGSHVIRQ